MSDSINIDFSPLQKVADPFTNYTNAFRVGRSLAGEQIAGNAMQAYAANPGAPIDPRLANADPATFLKVQGLQRDAQDRQANIKTAQALASGDTNGAMSAAAAAGDINTIGKVHEWARQAHEDAVKAASEKTGHLAQIAMAIQSASPDPTQRLAMAQHIAQLHPEYGIKPEDLTVDKFTDDGIQSSINDTLGVKGALDHALELRKQTHTEEHDTQVATETKRHNTADESTARAHVAIDQANLSLSRQRLDLDSTNSLTPEAIDYAAHQYLLDGGKMPALGMKSAGTRAAILNRVSAIQSAAGNTANDAMANHALIKGASSAMAAVAKQQAFTNVAAKTANNSADLVLQLAPKGGGTTNIPVINRWVQAGRKSIAGDADVAAFNASIETLGEEYAKVMTGATGSQAATDSARNAAHERLSKASTQQQLKSVITVLRQEMQYKEQNQAAEMQGQRETITHTGNGQPAPKVTRMHYDAQGNLVSQ